MIKFLLKTIIVSTAIVAIPIAFIKRVVEILTEEGYFENKNNFK